VKKYYQTDGEIGDFSKLPIRQKYALADLFYVAYGLLIVALVLISYIMGVFELLPHDPQEINMELLLASPATEGHILGTDFMGRDIQSRLIMGIQAYFLPGLLAISISLCGGIVLGVLAGYGGGKTSTVITYFTNLIDSFPKLVLILLVVAAFKPDIFYIMVVMGITGIPAVATSIANKIHFLVQKNFIEAAIALGLRTRVIIIKHILWYNCRALLIIHATIGMGEAILLETSLSYLGFGVQEPVSSWGNMVQSGANYFLQGNFWPSTAPALAILFTILGFNLLGDGLNNILEDRRNRL
jgi:peptide/nickel transport system permease protein